MEFAKVIAVIKRNVLALVHELKKLAGFDKPLESVDLQVLVARAVAGVVVFVAVALCFAMPENKTLQAVANALFKSATWLWSDSEGNGD